jgi:hypothetical protein
MAIPQLSPADSFSDPSSPPQASSPFKWIALGCGGCLGLTILLAGAIALLISRTMRFAIGPEGVTADQAPFTYTLPGESQGVLDMSMFGMQITQITSTDTPPSVLLTMGKLPSYLKNQRDQETFIESFQEGMVGDGGYQLTEQRTEERTLCGQPVAVLIQVGQYQLDQTTYPATSLLATVDYNSTTRFAWILAHGDTAGANVDQVFSSLNCQ